MQSSPHNTSNLAGSGLPWRLTTAHPANAPASPTLDTLIGDSPTAGGFAALLAAYRSTGGTARGDDVARLLDDHRLGNFDSLARLIATSDVFGFEWLSTLWIPMFQFELRDLSIKPGAQLVMAELGASFDGWARAAWFALPNSWLGDRRPVDLMDTDLNEVLGVARIDRFIAEG